MRENSAVRLYAAVLFAVTVLGVASPARAQFTPRSVGEPVVGEKYWVEGAVGLWSPNTIMTISSESLGIAGDIVDFKRDLGLQDHTFREFHIQLRPTPAFKLRYQYIPMKFTQRGAVITRQITWNGQLFTVGVPVNSEIDWKAHRIGIEVDFLRKDKFFVGFILDVKQTDVKAYLESPLVRRETAHAQAPIPAAGGIFRVYPIPNLAITGEITGFSIPDGLIKDTDGHYLDYDFNGAYNFTNNIGLQLGYRRFDLGYIVENDIGDFDLRGFYFGVVARY